VARPAHPPQRDYRSLRLGLVGKAIFARCVASFALGAAFPAVNLTGVFEESAGILLVAIKEESLERAG